MPETNLVFLESFIREVGYREGLAARLPVGCENEAVCEMGATCGWVAAGKAPAFFRRTAKWLAKTSNKIVKITLKLFMPLDSV